MSMESENSQDATGLCEITFMTFSKYGTRPLRQLSMSCASSNPIEINTRTGATKF